MIDIMAAPIGGFRFRFSGFKSEVPNIHDKTGIAHYLLENAAGQ